MKTWGTEKYCGKGKQEDKEGALRWREKNFLLRVELDVLLAHMTNFCRIRVELCGPGVSGG